MSSLSWVCTRSWDVDTEESSNSCRLLSFFHIYLTLPYKCASSKEVLQQEQLLTCSYECWQCISGEHRSRFKKMWFWRKWWQAWEQDAIIQRYTHESFMRSSTWTELKILQMPINLNQLLNWLGTFKKKQQQQAYVAFHLTIQWLLTVLENGCDQRLASKNYGQNFAMYI